MLFPIVLNPLPPFFIVFFFSFFFFFFFNAPAPTEIYPLPLHDALPISPGDRLVSRHRWRRVPRLVPPDSAAPIHRVPLHFLAPPLPRRAPDRRFPRRLRHAELGRGEIGRAHGWTPVTQ